MKISRLKRQDRERAIRYIHEINIKKSIYFDITRNKKELKKQYDGLIMSIKKNNSEYGYYLTSQIHGILEVLYSLKSKSFLDLGSGPGLLLNIIYRVLNIYTKGYEIEKVFVEDAKLFGARVEKKNILTLKRIDVETFDVIYFYEPFASSEWNPNEIKIQKFVTNLSKIMRVGQKVLYSRAGIIGTYLDNPIYGFKLEWYNDGLYLYEFIGKK